jgi:benzoyl-CoA 2,3-dioxygenase component B
MLTEEAHHMFVGESGVARVLQRTCEVMRDNKVEDRAQVRALGVIDLETIQRYVNFHSSVTVDLFGADQSSNAATFFSAGLKGRFEEQKRTDDHVLKEDSYTILEIAGDRLVEKQVPALVSLNERLRDDFIRDSQGGIDRWNKVMEKNGIGFRLKLPHKAFNRKIGSFAGIKVAPDGRVVSEAEWNANVHQWLPTDEDRAFVAALMGRVTEPGKFAGWIAPPPVGINRQPIHFEYVRFG